MWFALPFGVGCALCQYLLPAGARLWAAAGVLLLGLGSLLLRGRKRLGARLAAAGCAAGILWFSGYAALCLAPAEALADEKLILEMELTDYPEEAAGGARCEAKVAGLRGKVVFYGDRDLLPLEPGNRILAQAKCYSAVTLSGEESSYYISKGVFLRLYGSGELMAVAKGNAGSWRYLPVRLARWLRESVGRLYGPETGGLIAALLTGERDGLGPREYTDLSEAGLMHITAVSGLHCGFLIALLGLLAFRRQRLTAFLGYPVLLFYMVMVGCTPSVVRACVMAGFVLLAPLAGREGDTPTALSGALLAILLVNPFAIASVSLQLSFAAVAGLLLPTPSIYAGLARLKPERLSGAAAQLWRFFSATTAASLGVMAATAPLSAVYFGTVSLVSPLSNLLVLWMAPALFACALLGTVLGGAFPALAGLAAVPEWMGRYLLWAAHLTAGIPGHSVYFTRPAAAAWLAGTYVLLGLCLLVKGRRWKWGGALALSAVCLLMVKAGPRMQVRNDRLTAVAVDVGQGAAMLFHSGERTVLVDCGSLNSARMAGQAVAVVMDEYGWDKLGAIVLTHYHEDHAGGLPWLLARVEAEEFLLPQLAGSQQEELQQEVLELAETYGIAVRYIESPRSAALGDAVLTVYPPVAEGGVNEMGLTVLCSAGDFDFLITGDMNDATEKKLVDKYELPDIEVLAAGHHGSRYSTSRELLEAAAPEVGIVSVGQNRFGHPTQEAMDRMTEAGMEIRRTDEEGNILIQVGW
ncbi:MAG: ComEC/Rec2 family competence protein [Oscillospiraceae bacterium]|nr:ComEC/Rec2 family competence protein [Oscillospiraceae bacterium]